MTQIIEHINMQGKTFDVEPPLDQQAIQNSQRGISSGGAWQALQDMSPLKNKVISGILFSKYMCRIWERAASAGSFAMQSVTYAAGKYVACTGDGPYYSYNAKDWFRGACNSITFLRAVYTGVRWLAISFGGIYTSDDGITWAFDSGLSSSVTLRGIYFYNNVVVIATYNNGLYYCRDTSARTLTWTQVSETSSLIFNFVSCAEGLWVAGSTSNGLWWSTDGMSWTKCTGPTTGSFNCIHYVNGLWVAGSVGAGIYYSTNGKAWTQGTGPTTYTFNSIAYYNGLYIAGSTTYGIYYSTDGKAWTQCTGCTSHTINRVRAYSGVYVAASSNGGMWFSIDGINWGQSARNAGTYYSVDYCEGVWFAEGNGLYVCDINTLIAGGMFPV